ncbi:MAG: serine hydrolase domain-containing protein [Gemmatimonadales bacterium]
MTQGWAGRLILIGLAWLAIGPGTALGQSARERAVDSLFAAWNQSTSPGCAVGVVQDGRFVYRANYGMANLEAGRPIGARTAFYMASVSKQFAAAAVALASLQGKLSLDDDIRRFLPEMPDYGRPITVRHLVHHTSGIRDYLGMLALNRRLDQANSDEDVLRLIARQRALNFPTGSEYSYSNSGYMLLSLIIERATGSSLREYAERELFGPLGMRDTYFYDDHTKPHPAGDRRAIGYQGDESRGFRSGVLPNFEQVGDGGLISTVEDALRWDQNFYDGKVGGGRFLSLIQTPGQLSDGSGIEYAFGLMVRDYAGLRTVVHSGGFMGYRTIIQRFPDQRFSVIILCNEGSATPESLAPAIADLYLIDALDAAQRPLTGEYYSDELDVAWTIAADRGHLRLLGPSGPVTLSSEGKDAYRVNSPLGRANLTFTRRNGAVTGFTVALGPRTTGITFVKR